MEAAATAGRVPAPLPAVVYEREPGAASRPLPPGYRRREPEATVLHAVVREHLESFLAEARAHSESGAGYPAFVEHELRRFLDCGQLSRGFSRLRCPQCGAERLVVFSCKSRSCPVCWARRMADTAAHLVDRILPAIPYRQWVLTFPWPLRLPLALDRTLLSACLRTFLRTLFAFQRRRGRDLGIPDGQTGAVSFVQRFGGALNLNPHVHSVVPDGLFVPHDGDGPLTFVPLPPPTDEEVLGLTARLAQRLTARFERHRALTDDLPPPGDDEEAHLHAALAQAQWVPRDGASEALAADDEAFRKPRCAQADGFTLHAARAVAADDREGLEQLCRYGLRAPFAQGRCSRDPDGGVRYRLPKPWPNPQGRSELRFEPLAFLRRLAALIPAPYLNLTRYHGCFANRSRCRPRLPPPPGPGIPAEPPPLPATEPAPQDEPPPLRPRHLLWAQLLKRVLNVDALTCLRCQVPMVVLAFLTDPAVIKKILTHLRLPTEPLPLRPARIVEQEDLFANLGGEDVNQDPGDHELDRRPSSARGPP